MLVNWRVLKRTLHFLHGPKITLISSTNENVSINFDYIVQHLGIQAGGQIDVKKLADGRVELRAAKPAGKISDAFGMLKQPDGKVLSIQEINEVIAASWAGAKS